MPDLLTVTLVGAGHRTAFYAGYALEHPDKMKVVAVAEPNPIRRKKMAQIHNIPEKMQFESYEDLAKQPRLSSAVINGTMDEHHYRSTKPLLEIGYHVLLEKPITQTRQELLDLAHIAEAKNRIVVICHVLRYAPFYRTIKDIVDSGKIGKIRSLHSSENVSYHHITVAFIRGKWNRSETSTPLLMAKCCHDLDVIAWMMQGDNPTKVFSLGSLKNFRPENAPPGSSERCLQGCKIEKTCPYSARAQYVVNDKWEWAKVYVWPDTDMNEEQKMEFLRTESPHGKCIWHCDNNQVDHQSVTIEFAGGAIATHNLLCATARPSRTMHIIGTNGEIEGDFEDGIIKYRKFNLEDGPDFDEEIIDVNISGGELDGHGGGDTKLIADFVSLIQDPSNPALSTSKIDDSVNGHLIAFAADDSMRQGRVVEICSP